ncbi:MAG: flagellin [Planctomycetota bacterium]
MSSIPSSFARVPNLLVSRQSLGSINRTNLDLFGLQQQLSTGRQINRYSDNAVAAATISVLEHRMERSDQRIRNLDHADSALNQLDQALGEVNSLILEAESIASTQISTGSTASEREGQAIVVESLIAQLFNVANREGIAGSMFGGSLVGSDPVVDFRGGYRFLGTDRGLTTDVGLGETVPLTMPASNAVGATSARVIGDTPLVPNLTADTRVTDLIGARGLGISLGTIEATINGAQNIQIDLNGVDSAGDVADALTNAIRDYEATQTTLTGTPVQILGAGGVAFAGGSFTLDVLPGASIEFDDLATGVTARDLGLASDPSFTFDDLNPAGLDVRPKLTGLTTVASVPGLTLGQLRVSNGGASRVIDLAGAQTFEEIANAFETADLGVRVEFDQDSHRLIVLNEVSGGRDQALSISEVSGGITASALGVRTLSASTRLEDYNDGRGVGFVTGSADPITGLPDPEKDVDFTITLGDGSTVTVDLRPQDVTTTGALIARINAEAAAQLPAQGLAAGDLVAGLAADGNGITLSQGAVPAASGGVSIAPNNNSTAAEDIGLLDGAYDTGTQAFVAQDRATVRVDSLFTALIDLRDSLTANDTVGIQLASQAIDGFTDQVGEQRALVGGYARRISSVRTFEEDRQLLDQTTRSQVQDLDFAAASTELSMLQAQLQAGYTAAATANQLSLLQFLG